MVPAFLASLAIVGQVPIIQPPRLRTVLPNGAVILVEKIPAAKSLTMSLFVSSRGVSETYATNGYRHLIEHLAVKGRDGRLDTRLEAAGGFLSASTFRDVTAYEMTLPPGALKLGASAASEILRVPETDVEGIAREIKVIRQEGALRDDVALLTSAAWEKAYGERGLDAFGTVDRVSGARREDLARIQLAQLVGPNLAIVIAGNVDLDEATAAARDVLAKFPKAAVKESEPRKGSGGEVASDARGEARAALVGSFRETLTVATLAAGLAVGSELDDVFLSYTPSVDGGLVVVGRTTRNYGLGEAFDNAQPAALFERGRTLARRWLERQLADPASLARVRGTLFVQGAALRPETMLENLRTMTFEDFKTGLARFGKAEAVIVEGQR